MAFMAASFLNKRVSLRLDPLPPVLVRGPHRQRRNGMHRTTLQATCVRAAGAYLQSARHERHIYHEPAWSSYALVDRLDSTNQLTSYLLLFHLFGVAAGE